MGGIAGCYPSKSRYRFGRIYTADLSDPNRVLDLDKNFSLLGSEDGFVIRVALETCANYGAATAEDNSGYRLNANRVVALVLLGKFIVLASTHTGPPARPVHETLDGEFVYQVRKPFLGLTQTFR